VLLFKEFQHFGSNPKSSEKYGKLYSITYIATTLSMNKLAYKILQKFLVPVYL